jgi:peptide-methionine (R)-S-oxide reductase
MMKNKVFKTDEEWKQELTPEQYHITRQKGTERPFSGEYYNSKEEGIYRCVCCGSELFSSDTKYDSGTGWPSFWAPISEENVSDEPDHSLFMRRTEVLCAECGAHLGSSTMGRRRPASVTASIRLLSNWSKKKTPTPAKVSFIALW